MFPHQSGAFAQATATQRGCYEPFASRRFSQPDPAARGSGDRPVHFQDNGFWCFFRSLESTPMWGPRGEGYVMVLMSHTRQKPRGELASRTSLWPRFHSCSETLSTDTKLWKDVCLYMAPWARSIRVELSRSRSGSDRGQYFSILYLIGHQMIVRSLA